LVRVSGAASSPRHAACAHAIRAWTWRWARIALHWLRRARGAHSLGLSECGPRSFAQLLPLWLLLPTTSLSWYIRVVGLCPGPSLTWLLLLSLIRLWLASSKLPRITSRLSLAGIVIDEINRREVCSPAAADGQAEARVEFLDAQVAQGVGPQHFVKEHRINSFSNDNVL